MNKNVGSIYDHFLKFTNEFSEPVKRVFIEISDTVDKFSSLKMIDVVFDSSSKFYFSSTVDVKILSKVKSLLEHTVNSSAMNAQLTVKIDDTEYQIIVENGKYIQYPKEVAKVVKSMDVSAYLYFYYSLGDDASEDDIINFITKVFFSQQRVQMTPTQAIAHYFDLAVGNTVSSASSSKEAKSIANKQIEFEQLSIEIEKHREELKSVILKSKKKKEVLSQSKEASDISFLNDSQLKDLKADAAVLSAGIADTKKKLEKIEKLLPAIADELANGDLEKEDRLRLADVQKRTKANKVTYEKMLADNTIALQNISDRIKVLESEQISSKVKHEPESKVSKEIFELDGQANTLSDTIRELSDRLGAIRKEIALFNEKDDSMKYVSQVNFSDTLDFLNENYHMSRSYNLVYNFIVFYVKSKLTNNTAADKTAVSLFYSMFGF